MNKKVIDARAGDRWTKDKNGNLWLYRENETTCRMFDRRGVTDVLTTVPNVMPYRFPHETDIPTTEAHAQLRKWGYEVTDTSTVMPNGTVIETMYSYPSNPQPEFGPPITESRVREIVEEVLAAKVKPTPAPDDWQDRCMVKKTGTGKGCRDWDVFSPSGKYFLQMDGVGWG